MEEKKLINCIAEDTIRKLVNRAKELEIKKEDIVQLLVLGGQIHMIYYK